MSVKATIQLQLTVLETLTADVPDVSASGAVVRHDQFNVGPLALNSGTTPPAAQYSGQQYTGTQTLDLTNLLGTNGAAVNGTGLRPQALIITNLAANHGALTVAPGASNGIDLFGAGAGGRTIPLGGSALEYFGGNGPSISATAKTITITPNNAADTYEVAVLMG